MTYHRPLALLAYQALTQPLASSCVLSETDLAFLFQFVFLILLRFFECHKGLVEEEPLAISCLVCVNFIRFPFTDFVRMTIRPKFQSSFYDGRLSKLRGVYSLFNHYVFCFLNLLLQVQPNPNTISRLVLVLQRVCTLHTFRFICHIFY